MTPIRSRRKVYQIYLGQNLDELARSDLPEDIKTLWTLTWSGQLREAHEYSKQLNLSALPLAMQDLVRADLILLSVKIGLGLPATSIPFAWNSFANLIANYAVFSYYFWVDQKKAYRAIWRLLGLSLLFPFAKTWVTALFLLGHLTAIRGFSGLGYALANLMFRLSMRLRESGRRLPPFAENIIVSAFPYTNFVSARLDTITRLFEIIHPLVPRDPYYQSIFHVSCLYAFAYSGDVVRSELFSSHFKKLNQEKKLLRYQPVSEIIVLLPFALRGYAYIIEPRYQAVLKNHKVDDSDPAINSQFFRCVALIQIHLSLYDEALKSIHRAIAYRQQSGFHFWQKIDNQILRSAQTRTTPDLQPSHQSAGPHVNYFLTRLILGLKDFISEPEQFKDNLREILIAHFSWPDIIIKKDEPQICCSDPILKVDDHYLVFLGLPEDRASFIKEILASLRPYIISLERSQKQIRQMNDRIAGIATMTTIAQTAQMLAHDVRRPFSLTQSFMDLVREARGNEEISHLIEEFGPEIDRSLADVNCMIADVLEVGGMTKPALDAVEPADMIEKAIRDCFRRIDGCEISLHSHLEHRHKVLADQHKISRVLTNIVENAIEAMHGHGRLSLETHEDLEHVTFIIGNTGSFVPLKQRKKLFEAFYTSGKASGTGLGLAIAEKIVVAHGGEIWCESDIETGTKILFTLKPSTVPSTRFSAVLTKVKRQSPSEAGTPALLKSQNPEEPLAPPRFAVIEDSPLLRYQWSQVKQARLIQAFVNPSEFMPSFIRNHQGVADSDFLVVDRHFENDQTHDGLSCIQWLREQGYAGKIFLSSNSVVNKQDLIAMGVIAISKNLKQALQEIAAHLKPESV